jgi:hypothetical protein
VSAPAGLTACAEHPGRAAARTCARCGKGLCDECIAEERAGDARCRGCALADIDGGIAVRAAEGAAADAAAAERARVRPGARRRMLLALGVLVVAVEAALIFGDPPDLWDREDVPWTVGEVSPEPGEGRECARRIFAARVALDRRRAETGSPPARLEDLGAGEGGMPLVCPGSGRPLEYRPAGAGAVSCPDPAAHGVRAIRAMVPDRPPEVVGASSAMPGERP